MQNPSELAKQLLQIATQSSMAGPGKTLSRAERKAWELILNRLIHMPAGKRALYRLSKVPTSLPFQEAFLFVLRELLSQDQALYQSIAGLLTSFSLPSFTCSMLMTCRAA